MELCGMRVYRGSAIPGLRKLHPGYWLLNKQGVAPYGLDYFLKTAL